MCCSIWGRASKKLAGAAKIWYHLPCGHIGEKKEKKVNFKPCYISTTTKRGHIGERKKEKKVNFKPWYISTTTKRGIYAALPQGRTYTQHYHKEGHIAALPQGGR